MRKKPWRVRVIRQQEDWIEVQTLTAHEAEKEVAGRPGVVSVFLGSAIPADKPIDPNAGLHGITVQED